jgi:hypothetical protein
MQIQESRKKTSKIRYADIKIALIFFEEVTGINIGEELPQISIVPYSEIGAYGLQKGNKIYIAEELEVLGINAKKGVAYHELFHWALSKSGLERTYESYPIGEYKIALPLRLLLVKNDIENVLRINAMEEGTADLFASVLISRKEDEIPKNIFHSCFFENPSTPQSLEWNQVKYKLVKAETELVYSTFQSLNDANDPAHRIYELLSAWPQLFNTSKEPAYHEIGSVTMLLSYETAKKEGETPKNLLGDLIFNPWGKLEEVVIKIGNDKSKEILKNALSDFSKGFDKKKRLRHKYSFMEDFKERIRK